MMHRFDRLCVCLLLLSASLSAQTPAFKVIQPSGYAVGDAAYSPALLADGTLYLSGQGGSAAKDFAGQMNQAMANVQTVLHSAGMDFGNVVWMNIYLTDSHDLAAMDDVYWKMIGSSPPARTVLTVAALPH